MRSLLLKGITASLLTVALTPFANAQGFADYFVTAHTGSRNIQATVDAYNNTTTFLGSFASGVTAVQGTNTATGLLADDITLAPGFGGLAVVDLSFIVTNPNTTAVSARARTRYWLPDGPNGTPGTYIIGYSSTNVISFGANTYTNVTFTITPGQFILPAGGVLWAGLTFDTLNGASPATTAELANFGVGIFGPITVGSSADVMFRTTSAGSFQVNNPVGTTFNFTNNTPLANAGWRFGSTAFNLSGVVNLQGAVDKVQPVIFDFKIGGVSQFTRTVTLGADGSFTITGVPAKNYTISVKGDKWLRETLEGIDLTTADVTNFTTTLRAGDGNNDNTVDIGDLSLLIPVYNQIEGAPGSTYLDAADFNTDGANDFSDLSLVIGNYNQLGDS